MAKKTNISGLQPEKNPAGEPMQIILQKIDVRKPMRTEQDIPKWRQALRSAEGINPRRQLLYSLYADVEIDGHVESVVGKRKDAVTGANWQFVDKDGQALEEINELIDTTGFDELLQEIVNTRFWGYSILEPKFWKGVDDTNEMSAGLLPRYHYRVEKGIISYDAIGDEGINIREGIYLKTVMEVGNVADLGLYLKAAPYQILKRGGVGDWAAFIQVFGSPLVDAVWDGVDEKAKKALQDALTGLGPGGSIIRPAGTEVELKENRAKDTGDAHGNFMAFLNREISKALLGTTETTESSTSSGYAQSKTHADEDDSKHENDITYVRKVLNSRFIRILQAHGFDTKGGRFIVQGETQELTKKESFDIHKSLRNDLKLPIDDDFFYETYDVPRPDNYDALKQEMVAQRPPDPNAPEPPDKKKKTKSKNRKEEKEVEVELSSETPSDSFWRKTRDSLVNGLVNFFVKAPAVTTGAIPMACTDHRINLTAKQQIDQAGLIRRIFASNGQAQFDAELFWDTSRILISGFYAGWKNPETLNLAIDPSFVYGAEDPALLTAFEQNLFRFSAGKTLAQVQRLNEIFRQSSSFEEFYNQASLQIESYNRHWLESEYTTAVLTGQASSLYNRLKKQTDVFPYWQYRTAGDHLVRPTHQLLEGLILPANDSRWDKIFPPNGWNCRCTIRPRMANEVDTSKFREMRRRADAYLGSVQGRKEAATGWGVNRAKATEVFTANQQYVRKFKGKASKRLNALGFSDYGLDSYAKAKKAATEPAVRFDGDARFFYRDLQEHQGKKALFDYNRRPLSIQAKDFQRHTRDDRKRRAHRTEWLMAMEQAMKAPDEVWLQGSAMEDIIYLRYFQDATIVVRGKIGPSGIRLVSWFELAEKKSTISKIRRGLLVHKK